MENALSLIKQPEPKIDGAKEAKKAAPKREIKRPHVGVIELPKISTTPITDTLALKKEETPQTRYALTPSKKGKFSIKEMGSVAIVLLGIISAFGLKKKK